MSSTVQFTYTNYLNKTDERVVQPVCLWFGSTDYHKEYQWFMEAYDPTRAATRDFAIKDIHKDTFEVLKQGKDEELIRMLADIIEEMSER